MVGETLRTLWAEPRPADRPAPLVWERLLVVALVAWSVAEILVREDLAWRPIALAAALVVAASVLWRRTHPLVAVLAAFGTLAAVDAARIFGPDDTGLLWTTAATLLLPYALFRWGSGREAAVGLVPILVWLALTNVADPTGVAEVVAGYGFFLFSAALGVSARLFVNARVRDIEQVKLRERSELARELHDTVGHHLSAIAIQAQAGRAVATAQPQRALGVLETIEEAASRALEEMRAMVGILRDGAEPDLAPQPGIADIERLARSDGSTPRVEVQLSADLEGLTPSVGTALYRIAQEAVTNAVRHARSATQITVALSGDGDRVHMTVRDDGETNTPVQTTSGYGLVGMTERAALLGGTLQAGPHPDGGWLVDAVLPKGGAT